MVQQNKENTVEPDGKLEWGQRMAALVKARTTCPMLALLFAAAAIMVELLLFGGPHGIAVPLSLLAFCPPALWYISRGKDAFHRKSCWWLLPIALLSMGYLYNSNSLTHWITLPVLVILTGLLLLGSSGAADYRFSEPGFPLAAFHLFCGLPWEACRYPFQGVKAGCKLKNGWRSPVVYTLLGLLASSPFFVVLASLLSGADAKFAQSMRVLLRIGTGIPMGHVLADLLLGTILCVYLCTVVLLLRAVRGLRPAVPEWKGMVPAAASGAFLFSLVLLESAFVLVQFPYLFGGGHLPEGISYAEYARSGFFQIAAASMLTIAIIVAVSSLTAKKQKGLPTGIKVLLTAFTVCVFALYASAFARMGLYIEVYGLTVKRILVCWLMALLGILLCFVLFRVWKTKAKLGGCVIITVLLMVFLLNAARVDALTARFNVERYLDSPETVVLDVAYLGSLSADAAPYLEQLLGTPAEESAMEAMHAMQHRLGGSNWRTWSPASQKASEILGEYAPHANAEGQ